jgi:subtilisin-like proprotein convertase family protein
MSVHHWGEPVKGEWTLSIVDKKAGDVAACADFFG